MRISSLAMASLKILFTLTWRPILIPRYLATLTILIFAAHMLGMLSRAAGGKGLVETRYSLERLDFEPEASLKREKACRYALTWIRTRVLVNISPRPDHWAISSFFREL